MNPTASPTLGDLLESFFHRRLIAQQRVSPATVSTYRDSIRLLLTFAANRLHTTPSRLSIAQLDQDLVLTFLDALERERGNSVRTRNARRGAIRAFFHHVAACDPLSLGVAQRVLAIPGKRTSTPMLGFLTQAEVDALLAAPDRRSPRGRRDYALFLFLICTGARVSEAIAVDACDLRLEQPGHVLLRGKGAKERMVPLADKTREVLSALCAERAVRPHERVALFTDARGRRLTRFGVVHVMRRALATAAIAQSTLARPRISPHTLRHTAGMQLLQAGVELNVIRSWLGHINLDTTHKYVEADVEMKRKALEKTGVIATPVAPYQPSDELLAFLQRL